MIWKEKSDGVEKGIIMRSLFELSAQVSGFGVPGSEMPCKVCGMLCKWRSSHWT